MEFLKQVLLNQEMTTDKGIVIYHESGGKEFLSYKELKHQACLYAGALQKYSISSGQEVIILYQNNYKQFILTFWACVLADYLPIPFRIHNGNYNSVGDIAEICANPVVVCDESEHVLVQEAADFITVYTTKQIDQDKVYGKIQQKALCELAMIQFSSGSTSQPNGVAISNRNLLVNVADICHNTGFSSDDTFLSWVPITHNMGLIVFHILPLYLGANQVFYPTESFIARPYHLLEVIEAEQVTGATMNNYGMALLYQSLKQQNLSLDLSKLKFFLSGGELISVDYAQNITEVLQQYGAPKTLVLMGYGAAESTVGISTGNIWDEFHFLSVDREHLNIGDHIVKPGSPQSLSKVISVGTLLRSLQYKITDVSGNELGEDQVGILHIKGGSVARGYYNNPQRTDEVFGMDGWLNTGDIGFISKGELYLTGRYKNLILFHGKNYYGNDIENLLISNGFCEPNQVIITGLRQDENDLSDRILCFLLLQEYHPEQLEEHFYAMRNFLSEKIGVLIDVLIPVDDFPKTSSGKIQRYALTQMYCEGKWDERLVTLQSSSGKQRDTTQTTMFILKVFDQILEQEVTADSLFSELGISSLDIVKLYEKLSVEFPDINIADMFEYQTVQDLINYCSK